MIGSRIDFGFSGTRRGTTPQQRCSVNMLLYGRAAGSKFHHGDCIGSDAQAHSIARVFGFYIVVHPPSNPKNRAWCKGNEIRSSEEYMIRNVHIIEETNRMIATPRSMIEEFQGSGTWAAIRYSRKILRPLAIVWPDGIIRYERWPDEFDSR